MNIASNNFLWHKPVQITSGSQNANANSNGENKLASARSETIAVDQLGQKDKVGSEAKTNADEFKKVGEEFESLFLSMMIKEMRNTLDNENGGLFQGDSSDTLGGMFDLFMSQHMSEANSLGIGQALNRYMEHSMDNPTIDLTTETESGKEGTDANSGRNTLRDRIPIDIPPTTRIETFG